jgi:hypothetical protein
MANGSVTLIGQNTIFNPVGIIIIQDKELGFYKCSGLFELRNKTLTGLSKEIALKLAGISQNPTS